MSAPRVLITGCSGFIGRALASHCRASGWKVRGSVRNTDLAGSLPPGVDAVVVPDIGPGTDWSAALGGIEVVIHLAAKVDQPRGRPADPESEYFRVNTAGTVRLAQIAATEGIKRFIFLSTIKVNGEGAERPYAETEPENPHGPYAESKLAAERALEQISRKSGLEIVILRIPLVYGPGVKANFLKLIKLVERQIPLPLAAVSNRRSMLFLGNLVDALSVCMQAPKAAGQTFLVADSEHLSTPQLIRQIADRLGLSCRLFPCPNIILQLAGLLTGRGGEIKRLTTSLWADTAKIRQHLDWRPRHGLQEGLADTLGQYLKNKELAPKQ